MLTLHRYILWELLRIFTLALAGLSGIVVMAGIVQETSQQGLGPEHIFMLIPLLLPSTLPYTVPATMLFAVAVVYGRLSADNEITAIKAAGIPVRVAVWPAVLLSLLASAGVFVLHFQFIPHTHNRLRSLVTNESEDFLYAKLRRDLCFNEPGFNYSIYVREVHGKRLIGPIFKQKNEKGEYTTVASAEEAEIKVDIERRLIIVTLFLGDVIRSGDRARFVNQPFEIPFPNKANRNPRARERSVPEIFVRQGEVEQELLKRQAELGKYPTGTTEHLQRRYLFNEIKREKGELRVELAQRPALALGCLFFTLIGCPVAIWFQKSDFLSSFVTCFLPIVLIYYPLHMLAMNLGKDSFNAHLVLWMGNSVLGLAGLFLLWRTQPPLRETMGTLIDRYLLRHFIFAYLATFVSLLAMYIVIDVFAKFDEFATQDVHKVALKQQQGELAAGRQGKPIKVEEKTLVRQLKSFAVNVANYYAYRIPVFFQRINGILLLLAAAFTIGWMDRQNELTPLLAAGIPIGRLLIPLYAVTAIILAVGVLNTEMLIPQCADSLLRRAEDPMGKRPLLVPGAFDANHIHVEARVAFPQKNMIQYARVTLPPDVFGSTLHITCAEMYYRPGAGKDEHGWYMNGCQPATLPFSHPSLHYLQPGQFFLQTDLTYERITRRPTWYLFQPTPMLLDTIEHELGTAQRSAILVHIHQRLVAPLYDLLLLLLGLPLIASRSQWNIFLRVGWCLLIFGLVQALTMATAMLTKTELLDPAFAAWLPLMLLGPLVPPLLAGMRT